MLLRSITGFRAFQIYCKLKAHFTSEKYQFSVNGVNKISPNSYKKNYQFVFEKLANNYSEYDLYKYFIANFSYNSNYSPWEITGNEKEIYHSMVGNILSGSYSISRELQSLKNELEDNDLKVSDLFKSSSDEPYIVKCIFNRSITKETFSVLSTVINFDDVLDKNVKNLLLWNDVKLQWIKYRDLLDINFEKSKKLVIENLIVR